MAQHGVVSTINVLVANARDPEYSNRMMELTRKLRAGGSAFWPQMSPRTIDFRINWETSMVFMMLSEWHRIPNAVDDAERARLLQDPAWRARRATQWDQGGPGLFPSAHPERVRIIEVAKPDLEPWLGRTLADLTAARGGHPSDVFADWVLENDLRPGILVVGVAQRRRRRSGEAARRPRHRGGLE